MWNLGTIVRDGWDDFGILGDVVGPDATDGMPKRGTAYSRFYSLPFGQQTCFDAKAGFGQSSMLPFNQHKSVEFIGPDSVDIFLFG